MNKVYDLEFKKQTVQHMIEEKKSMSQVSREMGIAMTTLAKWMKLYHPNPQELEKGKVLGKTAT